MRVRKGALLAALFASTLFAAALAGGGGPKSASPCTALKLPADWLVLSRAYGDVTNDGLPECVLVVWRPWRDWHIRRWSDRPSPIQKNHDAEGRSAHIAVLEPLKGGRYRERWVGSALLQPALSARVAREGGQGVLVVREGNYAAGPTGPAVAVSVWRWNGFGFRLERRERFGERHFYPV